MNTLFFLILVSDAIQPCVKCKFFKNNFFTDSKFGKCSLYPKSVENSDFFVTGIETPKKIEYTYCSVARTFESMCGEEGKFYQKAQ
jgi:hypothetical protein